MGYTLHKELEGSNNVKKVLDTIIHKTKIFGETFGTIVTMGEIAEEVGLSDRTARRHIKSLEDQGFICTSTKRGQNGGTVVVLNNGVVEVRQHPDNPITGTTKTAEEIREKYLPNKPEYEKKTNRTYRTREEIAEERLLQTEQEKEYERLNDLLTERRTPDRDFFKQTEDPELYYKAWLLSRMYNAFLVEYPRIWMNTFESKRNKEAFEWAKSIYNKYRNYEILRDGRFVGTQTFEHFMKLSQMLDEKGYNPVEYLESQFRYFFYLISIGKNATPPFVNTLWTDKVEERFLNDKGWKKDFDREHPYFRKPGDIVSRVDSRAILLLDVEYQKGFYNDKDMFDNYIQTAYKDQPMEFYQNRLIKYYKDVMEAIEANDELTEEEVKHTTQWVKQAIAVNMERNSVTPYMYLVANYRQVKMNYDMKLHETGNVRKAYFEVGNYSKAEDTTPMDNQYFIEKGYHTYWAVEGHASFYNMLATVSKVRQTEVSWKVVRGALEKLDIEFPVSQSGLLDVKPYIRATMTDNEKMIEKRHEQSQLELSKYDLEQIKDEEWLKGLDTDANLWFNIMEPVPGLSRRDGLSIVEQDSLPDDKGKDLVDKVMG